MGMGMGMKTQNEFMVFASGTTNRFKFSHEKKRWTRMMYLFIRVGEAYVCVWMRVYIYIYMCGACVYICVGRV